MGRVMRKVPEDWVHPKIEQYGKTTHQPMFEASFKEAADQWAADFNRMNNGDMTKLERECYPLGVMEWANDEAPPDPKYYMPDWPAEDRTHYQMYEDTTEGTPISPAMETPEKLAQWLVDNEASSFGNSVATYQQWLSVCVGGYAPSMVIIDRKVMSGVDAMSENNKG